MNRFEQNYPRRYNEAPPRHDCSGASTPTSSYTPSLAMAYIAPQSFDDLFELPVALQKGTIFQALDFPFYGGKFRCASCCNQNR